MQGLLRTWEGGKDPAENMSVETNHSEDSFCSMGQKSTGLEKPEIALVAKIQLFAFLLLKVCSF